MKKEIKDLTKEEIKAMNKEERQALHAHFFEVYDLGGEDRVYWLLNEIEDEEYYEENIEKFKEYEAKMNEPDFDWDFYSDWHKDMFGYRPHKKVIPKDMAERRQIFEDFHRERGF